jgi:hypothetical protein
MADERRPIKKLQSQFLLEVEKIVTIKLKIAKKRVLKSPAQMAFLTFILTFSKVAGFATFWEGSVVFYTFQGLSNY